MSKLKKNWENIEEIKIERLQVPGGWLVKQSGCKELVYVPDAKHEWDFEERQKR